MIYSVLYNIHVYCIHLYYRPLCCVHKLDLPSYFEILLKILKSWCVFVCDSVWGVCAFTSWGVGGIYFEHQNQVVFEGSDALLWVFYY